jgi:hypothetical protein
MFTEAAGQVAGQVGQVVGLLDPAESDEWVVVRFGRDELPFSPGDLEVAPKGAVARKVAAPPPAPAPRVEPEFVIDKPLPVTRKEEVSAVVAETDAASPKAGLAPAPRKASGAARPVKVKAAPGLTVTLAYADGEWTVAAAQGAKVLAKPYVIKPVEALRMVALVDVPGVREAVEQIMATERAEAEREADRLRAELAEIEVRLAELRDAG